MLGYCKECGSIIQTYDEIDIRPGIYECPICGHPHTKWEIMRNHVYFQPCDCNCNGSCGCPVCDGGLAICRVCGLAEGSLTTDCPGVLVPAQVADLIYDGIMDFRAGQWVYEKNPTNQMWDRYRA